MKRLLTLFGFLLVSMVLWLLVFPSLGQSIHEEGLELSIPTNWQVVSDDWRLLPTHGWIDVVDYRNRAKFGISRSTDSLTLDQWSHFGLDEVQRVGQASPLSALTVGGYPAITYLDWTPDIENIHSGGGIFTVGEGKTYERTVRLKIGPTWSIDIGCELSRNPIFRFRDDILCKRIVNTIRFDPASFERQAPESHLHR